MIELRQSRATSKVSMRTGSVIWNGSRLTNSFTGRRADSRVSYVARARHGLSISCGQHKCEICRLTLNCLANSGILITISMIIAVLR